MFVVKEMRQMLEEANIYGPSFVKSKPMNGHKTSENSSQKFGVNSTDDELLTSMSFPSLIVGYVT